MTEVKRTTGQKTGVEANPSVEDQRNGQFDSGGVGNQGANQASRASDGSMNTPRLTSAISPQGQESDITLYSGPRTGRTSEQDFMESIDEREKRWKPAKDATQEPPGVFTEGNASVRLERSTKPYVTEEAPRWKPRQGKSQQTEGPSD